MLEPLPLVILFASSYAFAHLLIKWLITPLSNFGMVDVPGSRRAHKTATPRGGGLAIVLILIVVGPLFELNILLLVTILRH